RALLETGVRARKNDIADAMMFRAYRRSLVPDAARAENALEINEALAEYTGVRLANPEELDARIAALKRLSDGPHRPKLSRSFAYSSGPAYGLLLDAAGKSWRTKLKPDSDLGALLATAYSLPVRTPKAEGALAVAQDYDGANLIAFEEARALKDEAHLA